MDRDREILVNLSSLENDLTNREKWGALRDTIAEAPEIPAFPSDNMHQVIDRLVSLVMHNPQDEVRGHAAAAILAGVRSSSSQSYVDSVHAALEREKGTDPNNNGLKVRSLRLVGAIRTQQTAICREMTLDGLRR